MGISKEDAVKELQNRDIVYVAYSQATKLPYVKCDEESYNDQAWIFSTQEAIKEFGKKLLEDKILLMGMKFEKKDYPRFYGTLYAIGVNTVVWVDGEEQIEVELSDIAKQADMSKIEEAKRPLLNSTLQLSGIYFMQELRRPVKPEEHGNIRELEEEFLVNIKKSDYLVAMDVDPEDPKKINIPYLKNKKEEILQPVFSDVMELEKFTRGKKDYLVAMDVDPEDPKKINIPYLKNKKEEILQPVFSDVMELEKFTRGKKLRVAKIPFAKLPELMMEQAAAYVINPMGFNLVLNRDQLKKIIG